VNESLDKSACADHAGKVAPVINRGRCEGKADCVTVCPYEVFQVRQFSWDELGDISLRGKLKAWAHKRMQADVVAPEACHACGLCLKSCPENAITLEKIPA
jgi:NAD-dependent dihydropyrimidine dehydrogenase PreA subunit